MCITTSQVLPIEQNNEFQKDYVVPVMYGAYHSLTNVAIVFMHMTSTKAPPNITINKANI